LSVVTSQRLSASLVAVVVAGVVVLVVGVPSRAAARSSTGRLYAFGVNGSSQLGRRATDPSTQDPNNPTPTLVSLPGASGAVTKIAASDPGFRDTTGFSLVVTSTGQLYAFGDNNFGELGNATNNHKHCPPQPCFTNSKTNPTPRLVRLPGASGAVTKVAAGADFSLVVTSTGQLYAFGDNDFGELGNATNNLNLKSNPPRLVRLPGAGGRVTRVAAGDEFSLVVTSNG
jgi:alpha-tubulin suppressor-like RCC1 family protein